MDAPVGAHIEEIAPRRIVLPADFGYLLVLVIASFIIHAWLITHTSTTARDSMRFARTVLNLEHPNARLKIVGGEPRTFADVLRDGHECPDPPGFPLAVLGTSKIVRSVYDAPLPEQMLLSGQVASSIAAILLVFPTYWLGRMLFGQPFAGFAGALLFQALPTVAHLTSDGLSDSSSLLCAVTALVCSVRALRAEHKMVPRDRPLPAAAATSCGPKG